MKYIKVVNGVVIQVQPNEQEGFIATSEDVCAGMLYNNGILTMPAPIPPTQAELDELAFEEWKVEQAAIKEAALRAEFEAGRNTV